MTTLSTFTSTVGPNHTIILPDSIPVGAKVTITVSASSGGIDPEESRSIRFERVMDALRKAMAEGFTAPAISNNELKALIKRARTSKK